MSMFLVTTSKNSGRHLFLANFRASGGGDVLNTILGYLDNIITQKMYCLLKFANYKTKLNSMV